MVGRFKGMNILGGLVLLKLRSARGGMTHAYGVSTHPSADTCLSSPWNHAQSPQDVPRPEIPRRCDEFASEIERDCSCLGSAH